jgi:hypothetical protein
MIKLLLTQLILSNLRVKMPIKGGVAKVVVWCSDICLFRERVLTSLFTSFKKRKVFFFYFFGPPNALFELLTLIIFAVQNY